MFFSLITPVAGRERQAAHERPTDCYADHQWLWRLFPAPPGTPREFLFRRSQADGLPRFHVVSRRPPEPAGPAWEVRTLPYAPRLVEGDRLAFELRANPCTRHGRDGKSKRHDVVMEAKRHLQAERGLQRWRDVPEAERPLLYDLVQRTCSDWLARMGSRLGFVPDQDTVRAQAYQQQEAGAARKIQFSTVELQGQLTVRQPDAFVQALYQGVGPAKAFGCGLMLVRPIG
jgi:CRISPR system Cascade subunit CasE